MPYKDPEKQKEYDKLKRARIKANPELLKKSKKQAKEASKRHWEKVKADPILHEKVKEQRRITNKDRDQNTPECKEYRKKRWIKIKSDPILHEKNKEIQRITMQKRRSDDEKHSIEYENTKKLKRYNKDKLFEILGGKKCSHCNESREEALEFDHINNDGSKDRKKFKNHPEVMRAYYVKNPETAIKTLRVLCGNCNIKYKFESGMIGISINSETKIYKDKVYEFFGNKCVKCGFGDINCLGLDHKKGGGKKERSSKFRNYYINFYKYYSEHPKEAKKELDLLCRNCNLVKKHSNNENSYQY